MTANRPDLESYRGYHSLANHGRCYRYGSSAYTTRRDESIHHNKSTQSEPRPTLQPCTSIIHALRTEKGAEQLIHNMTLDTKANII